ncbi:hypothetical protein FKP32DRAFT_1722604 [Trametes sanguinea]|nr:hypothetical protein FKP32DRAFT_1722604 [Trametes sanguinea]
MADQESNTAAQTTGASAPSSASPSAPSSASEVSSTAPAKTDDGHEPAPPTQSSAESSAASKPSSSPSRPSSASAKPTQPPSSPSTPASNSASHSAAPQTSAPSASSPSPAAPVDSADPTSLHAVSSPSFSSNPSPDDTPSVTFIPPRVTKADPVVHSTTVVLPTQQPAALTHGGTIVQTSESEPVLTPLVQNNVSEHASAAAPAGTPASSDAAPHEASEVHAPPSAAPLASVSSPASVSSDSGSKNGSGLVQANAKTAAPTSTSTVTDKPETTLSSPVFETVTDAEHHTSLTLPPVFTSVQVSQLPDGGQVSITHIIANPTGIYGVQAESSSHGFFSHSGAVAGVFLAIGIIITAIFLGICLFLRRRRRRNPRFITTISRPLPMPDNPFEDPRDLSPPPQMRYASGYTDRTLVIDGGRPAGSPFDDSMAAPAPPAPTPARSSSSASSSRYNGLGLAGIGAHGRSGSMGSTDTSASETRLRHPSGQSGVIGLAITSDQHVGSTRERRPPPSAQSSPSIYPPTLPDEGEAPLVNVPLHHRNSSTPSVHSVTRKPVPSADTVPSAPERVPAPPEQHVGPDAASLAASAAQTPAHHAQHARAARAPAHAALDLWLGLGSASTEMMETIALKPYPYEPLTPPTSYSSISPAGSSIGHESSPTSTLVSSPLGTASSERANPFVDIYERALVRPGPPGLVGHIQAQPMPPAPELAMAPTMPRKETFYTRRNGSQRRPSVEWKN